MNRSTTIFFNLSTVTSASIYNEPVILKGKNTVNFILTGITEPYNTVLFLDIIWGDSNDIVSIKKDAVYDYRNQSIFNEILYGKIGGSVCTSYSHDYINNSVTHSLNVVAKFILTYDSGETVSFYQPFNIYHGSFYDDIKEYVAINSQILPISYNTTFVNFESKNNIQIVPSLLTSLSSSTQYTSLTSIPQGNLFRPDGIYRYLQPDGYFSYIV